MKREIIKIDEEKCNGCGLCIPNCHEGALQIIDGKARLVSDLMCDGLGACIGHCPEDALEIEVREAEPYDEVKVMKSMVNFGANTVTAHLKHLKDHGEEGFLKQAVEFLLENEKEIGFPVRDVIQKVDSENNGNESMKSAGHITNTVQNHTDISGNGSAHHGCGGARHSVVNSTEYNAGKVREHHHLGGCPEGDTRSHLTQWPVQMHLINPHASQFAGTDLLLAADCVAYSLGNFHSKWLKGKSLAIACPKLDSNKEVYLAKLVSLIDDAKINTITVMKMEVPCCGGIEHMAISALRGAARKVPVKSVTVSVDGKILNEVWL